MARWSVATGLGLLLAVTIALESSLSKPATGALAIALGAIVTLAFSPWRSVRHRAPVESAVRQLSETLRAVAAGEEDRSRVVLPRDDALGELSRVIHDTLARAGADRRAARLLQRTMDDTIRRETDRATLRLRREAATDPLTGLGNRRTMEQKLDELFTEADRRGTQSVVAMLIDLDLFKPINDRLGHTVGDTCLTFLGNLLLSTLRREDCAIRLGGDEFAVLMPNRSLDDAHVAAVRIRALFGQMPWSHDGVPRPTVSIGLAAAGCREPDGRQDLLHRADTALYGAKGCGRDAIQVYHARTAAAS